MTRSFGEQLAPGFRTQYRGEALYSGRSRCQKIDVYEHEFFGRVLVLDDLVQTTERDEFCYHEMLVHPALCSRERVERVLIIGGGDGGTLRHVLMHDPKHVVMCEIDEEVVRVCRELMPALSDGAFDDPRAEVLFDDGATFVRSREAEFDAIIVDGSDAVGPATVLFSEEFYASCRRALVPGGVLVSQTGSPDYHTDEFRLAYGNLSLQFPTVEPYLGYVPTYPGSLWTYMAATDGDPVSSARLHTRRIAARYYSPDVHRGAFALPGFVRELVASAESASVPRG